MTLHSQHPEPEPAAATHSRPTELPAGRGIYLFCCARPEVTAVLDGQALEPGQLLRGVPFGDVVALCCEVSLADWTGPLGEEHLGDLTWLGPRALRHEAVIERAMALAPLLPMPLGTLFSSEAALLRWLACCHAAVSQFLTIIADKEEWSLKGILDEPRAEEERFLQDPRLATLGSGGARYLMEKKLRAAASQQVRTDVRQAEEGLLHKLRGIALMRRLRRILPQQSADAQHKVVFHSALLIPAAAREEFLAVVAEYNAAQPATGLVVEATGPWPAASFTPSLAPSAAEGDDAASI